MKDFKLGPNFRALTVLNAKGAKKKCCKKYKKKGNHCKRCPKICMTK